MTRWALAGMLLLGGCSTTVNWTKADADAAGAAAAYQDCRDLAGTAVKKDVAIDQDILASRSSDRQRADIVRVDSRNMGRYTGDRENSLIASCMRGKGFTKKP